MWEIIDKYIKEETSHVHGILNYCFPWEYLKCKVDNTFQHFVLKPNTFSKKSRYIYILMPLSPSTNAVSVAQSIFGRV